MTRMIHDPNETHRPVNERYDSNDPRSKNIQMICYPNEKHRLLNETHRSLK